MSVERFAFPTRKFHGTAFRPARRKPAIPSVKVENMGRIVAKAPQRFPKYTEEEKELLAKKYTAEQLNAIEAGEQAIDVKDLAAQGEIREDSYTLRYWDDMSQIRPVIDKPVKAPHSNYDPNLRHKTEDEILDDYGGMFAKMDEETTDADARLMLQKLQDQIRLTVGKEEAEKAPTSYLAPKLPKIQNPSIRFPDDAEEDQGMRRVMQRTGFNKDEMRKFRIKTLVQHRVVNQTRMGKISSQYALTIAGDGKGLLGIGEGKSSDFEDARKQSTMAAIRNMEPIRRYEERTIFGEAEGKVGAAVVKIMSRPPGFGVRCQHNIFEMCRCAGITDLAARVSRSRNPMNVAKATLAALKSQRSPEDIARARGKKLVDVRKVYYGDEH